MRRTMDFLDTTDKFAIRAARVSVQEFSTLLQQYGHYQKDPKFSDSDSVLFLIEAVDRLIGSGAIRLGSQSLDERIQRFEKRPSEDCGNLKESLLRYLMRATFRPIPFGGFAGFAVGQYGPESKASISEAWLDRYEFEIDSNVLSAVQSFAIDSEMLDDLLVVVNSTVSRIKNRARYIRKVEGQRVSTYQVQAVDLNSVLDMVLKMSENPCRAGLILDSIVRIVTDCSLDDARDYLRTVIGQGLLQVVDRDVVRQVFGSNKPKNEAKTLGGKPIKEIKRVVSAVDKCRLELSGGTIGSASSEVRKAIEAFSPDWGGRSPINITSMIDMDDCILAKKDLRDISTGIEILRRMCPWSRVDKFEEFKTSFIERYQDGFFPLLEVLDEEIGIGYPPHTKEQLPNEVVDIPNLLDIPHTKAPERKLAMDLEYWMSESVVSCLKAGNEEIEISNSELDRICQVDGAPLPSSMGVVASLFQTSDENPELRTHLRMVAGAPATRLIGRVAHLDRHLMEIVDACNQIDIENCGGAIVAEIDHQPHRSVGNIVNREHVSEYVIDLFGYGKINSQKSIELTDLYVGLVNNQVALYSKKYSRFVIPRLSSAHNFTAAGNLHHYQFLCNINQQQSAAALTWFWGPLESVSYLPRVRYGNVILARRRWRITAEEMRRVRKKKGAERWREFRRLQKRLDIPRYCQYGQIDLELSYDFDSSESIDMFVNTYNPRMMDVIFEDLTCSLGGPFVKGPAGGYHCEVMLPLRNREYIPAVGNNFKPGFLNCKDDLVTMNQFPGGQWTYSRIYCGPNAVKQIILNDLSDLVRSEMFVSGVSDWHFLRYRDTNNHIRVRWRAKSSRANRAIRDKWSAQLADYIEKGEVWKLEYGTYRPEVYRYGGKKGVALAEKVFSADSELAIRCIALNDSSDEGEDIILRAVCVTAFILDNMLGSETHKLQVLQGYGESLFKRTGATKRDLSSYSGKLYRKYRDKLRCIANSREGLVDFVKRADVVDRLQEALNDYAKYVGREAEADRFRIAFSLCHMHLNRVLNSYHVVNEPFVYALTARALKERRARIAASSLLSGDDINNASL